MKPGPTSLAGFRSWERSLKPLSREQKSDRHDQILGGPDGQIFLGCRFPADAAYRLQLQEMGVQVGKNLALKGALERYGVDFIAVKVGENQWHLEAIEINLRKGGTTHPFMTLKYLTKGHYNLSSGLFHSQHGPAKYYIATDNLQRDSYRGLLPHDLIDIVAHHQLHFDSSTETGSVFHLIGCLSEFGKLGLTSIGNSPQEAEDIYNHVIATLDQETTAATPHHAYLGTRFTATSAGDYS
jgi:PGM1 C-terminal domain